MHSDVSNFYSFLKNYSDQLLKEYSFLHGKCADHQQWRTMTQSKVFELLGYFPSATPFCKTNSHRYGTMRWILLLHSSS